MNLRPTIVVFLLVASLAAAQEYNDFDDRPARRQARGPIIGSRGSPKQQLGQKTTSTTEAPIEEDEYVDELVEEEPEPTTTTEAPKKGGIRGGVVRPFRSNEDLLNALKRKRQQQASGGYRSQSSTTTQAPNNQDAPSAPASSFGGAGSRARGAKTSRFGSGRGATSTTTTEEPEPTQRNNRLFGRGRRF